MRTIDISGFGGGYEECCQKMLTNGMVYLARITPTDGIVYESFKNVTGLCIPKGDEAKKLDKAIMNEVFPGMGAEATGAQHHHVVSHLMWILNNGYDNWLEAAGEKRCYEYEDEYREEVLDKFPWPKPEGKDGGQDASHSEES